jgi:hypothetical protein
VPPPCPEFWCANEWKKANLSAWAAVFSNVPPSSTPGSFDFTDPVTERYSAGADILGSKVSTWVGPPPSQSQTTDVLRVGLPALDASARALSRPGNVRPPRPRAPIFRKSRRVLPSQAVPLRDERRVSMAET